MLSEDYIVELLKKLPVYHRNIYEFQQIAGAQEPELQALLIAIDAVLDNWFVFTANEAGISRLEKIAGITPDTGSDLETRRYRLLAKMTEKIPYTDETLEQRLGSLAGEGNYSIVRDYLHYKIQINMLSLFVEPRQLGILYYQAIRFMKILCILYMKIPLLIKVLYI